MAAVTVVGGGIIGLSTARALLIRGAKHVRVLDSDCAIARSNQTGNNSGVVHAGIYYKAGSLKAQLCAKGRAQSYEYFEKRNIAYHKCGKLIVALNNDERIRLERIFENASSDNNQVPGLKWIRDPSDIEPNVRGVAAIHSQETGIVDWGVVARSYAQEIEEELGGEILLGHHVTNIENDTNNNRVRLQVLTDGGEKTMYSERVVSCAGIGNDRLTTAETWSSMNVKTVPIRGEYLRVRPIKAGIVRGCVYPVPYPGVPFLGVHFTPTIDGELLVGPNAVPAWSNLNGSLLQYGGLWKLAWKYRTFAASEIYRSIFTRETARLAAQYIKPGAISLNDFTRCEWSGIRAQAVDMNDGTLVDDFVFDENQNSNIIMAKNTPSPGATSSLPIGKMIAERMLT